MKAATMSKPKRQRDEQQVQEDKKIAEEIGVDVGEPAFTMTPAPTEPTIITGTEIAEPIVLKPRRYAPPPCSCCTALRPAGKDFTEVYRTTRETGYIFRYCKCGYCGNTFKDSERV